MCLIIMCNYTQSGASMTKKGIFIVIEGLDGSGKTTQARTLTKQLLKSHNAMLTAEPSQGKIGSFIREHCLYGETRFPIGAEALLFAADRIEHIQNEVLPALKAGKLVICDRYIYSSLAYQGSAGLSVDWIKTINARALQPDFAIFIDVSPERVLERLQRKRSVMETLGTQQKVREIYLKYVDKGELIKVEGDKPREIVAEELHVKVLGLIKTAEL
jgi:dTMP kinase